MKTNGRKLSDYELHAELNRYYFAEHGKMPPEGFWFGDREYLDEVRAQAKRREAELKDKTNARIAKMLAQQEQANV